MKHFIFTVIKSSREAKTQPFPSLSLNLAPHSPYHLLPIPLQPNKQLQTHINKYMCTSIQTQLKISLGIISFIRVFHGIYAPSLTKQFKHDWLKRSRASVLACMKKLGPTI